MSLRHGPFRNLCSGLAGRRAEFGDHNRRLDRARIRRRAIAPCALLVLTLAACSSGSDAGVDPEIESVATSDVEVSTTETLAIDPPATDPPVSDPAPTIPPATDPVELSPTNEELTANRPYDVFVPTGYNAAAPTPLVLLLHGYTVSGDIQEAYFKFEPLAESRGFLYVHPDGTVDAQGEQFWNATDACCAFRSDAPDDAGYLMAIIEQVSAEYNVDPKAIFLAGHSNGGFMSYRMACQHADTIAGIASLAGATFADTADCAPSEPVSVLQVHGTNDQTIFYDGGSNVGNDYPSAPQTVEAWVAYNGCDTTPAVTADALDLDAGIEGADSHVEAFVGCEQGSEVELWSIDGGSHIPGVTEDFSAGVIDFLLAHPKP
ncbi:MAG: polyhydroxybutyrate depolymerase [Ilumatobacter sp.]|jgi:polyhydroxybutyrate depolymerase